MKKFLITVMVIALSLALTGCEVKNGEKVYFDRFVVLEELNDPHYEPMYVVYDKETNVEYYYWISYQRTVMSPIYNADGTVKVYEGE